MKGKYDPNVYLLENAVEVGLKKALKDSSVICVNQLMFDEENTAVMRWFYDKIKKTLPAKFVYYEDLSRLKFGCSDSKITWKMNHIKCDTIMSLYPKEWLITEARYDATLSDHFASLNSIEPWWKIIVGNKAILPVLYKMFPKSQYLLPAYF